MTVNDAGDDEIHIQDGHTMPVFYEFEYSGNEGNDEIYDNLTGERNITFRNNYNPAGNTFLNSVKYYQDGSDLVISYINNETQQYTNSIRFVDFMNLSEASQNNLKYYYYDNYDNKWDWYRATVKSFINEKGYEQALGNTPAFTDELTQSVASWQTSNGSEYSSVNDVLANSSQADINVIAAQFDNTNWQHV